MHVYSPTKSLVVLAAIAVCDPAKAQVTLHARAETAVAAFANDSSAPMLRSVPKSTVWTQDATIHAQSGPYTHNATRLDFRATTGLSIVVDGNAVRTASGRSVSYTSKGGAAPESHTIAVFLRSPSPTTGRVIISLDGREFTQSSQDGAVASAIVTIGTTRMSFRTPSAPVLRALDVTIPSAGLMILVESFGSAIASGSASYRVEAKIDFVPDTPCSALVYGGSCATVVPSWPSPRTLQSTITSRARNGIGIPMLGAGRRDILLPFLPCRLLLEPIATLPGITLDAAGSGKHALAIPAFVGRFYVQHVLVYAQSGRSVLATTPGLQVDCK